MTLASLEAADSPRLRWIIKDGLEVNRARGERLYLEASRTIEERFTNGTKTVRPAITVHVGTACPDTAITDSCLSPSTSELFLPRWDDSAAGAVTQATLILGMMQLLDPSEVASVARTLVSQDAKDFLDVHSRFKD